HRAAFAGRADAERVGGGGHLAQLGDVGRQVGSARHGVVHKRAGEHLAALRIVVRVFQQGLPNSLGNAAVDLTVNNERVHGAADVVDGDVGDHLDRTGVGIDFDFADVGAIRVAGLGDGLVACCI